MDLSELSKAILSNPTLTGLVFSVIGRLYVNLAERLNNQGLPAGVHHGVHIIYMVLAVSVSALKNLDNGTLPVNDTVVQDTLNLYVNTYLCHCLQSLALKRGVRK